ncbi:VOC family protein [Nocardiopsis composta]|uniref:Putative enzyme related to lactoylglutathione lyase n=1 Tax=Nocardiopsis composta TaxID=157465 RepID=A0A7W8QIZ8_9ACTN|nr:VOC family protein [Nocardiopsis composta]MBB5430638.1 putative enzyme related to lactoylglutathione lyase [Nocardiopsis composta]
MLRGLTTVNFWADDLQAAKEWYTELLDSAPYFERSGPDGQLAYMEFRIGDYQHELGFINSRFRPPAAAGGAVLYWHVDDVEAAFKRLLSMGAEEHEGVTERGPGFVTASVVDPFGNLLGVMYNAHYLEILEQKQG